MTAPELKLRRYRSRTYGSQVTSAQRGTRPRPGRRASRSLHAPLSSPLKAQATEDEWRQLQALIKDLSDVLQRDLDLIHGYARDIRRETVSAGSEGQHDWPAPERYAAPAS